MLFLQYGSALKQIKVTLKKTTSFKEQDPEKVAEFLDILDNLKDLPVVYIDGNGNRPLPLSSLCTGSSRGEKSMKR